MEMSGVRLQAGQAGSRQPSSCSVGLAEKPEMGLFQARLTLSAQLPSAREDLEGWGHSGRVETRR